MDNQINGKIVLVLPEQSGTRKDGNAWVKQSYVLETNDQYPKKIMFSFMGEVRREPLQIGQNVCVHINIESREYNGRYYTDVRAWKIENVIECSIQPQQQNNFAMTPEEAAKNFVSNAPQDSNSRPLSNNAVPQGASLFTQEPEITNIDGLPF